MRQSFVKNDECPNVFKRQYTRCEILLLLIIKTVKKKEREKKEDRKEDNEEIKYLSEI